MLWLLEGSDEVCVVTDVECTVVGKMFDCLYFTKLGTVDGNLTGIFGSCVDSCVTMCW